MEKLTPHNTTQFLFKALALTAIVIALLLLTGEIVSHLSMPMVIVVMTLIAFAGGALAHLSGRTRGQ